MYAHNIIYIHTYVYTYTEYTAFLLSRQYIMSHFNVHTSHPIIPRQEFTDTDTFYASISSQDRNITKNPDSNNFKIELPQDYSDVQSVKLSSAYFPIIDDQFSQTQNNVDLYFRFKPSAAHTSVHSNPINVTGVTLNEALTFAFVSESASQGAYFHIRIQNGKYTVPELANEIQNRMNQEITHHLLQRITGTQPYKMWGVHRFTPANSVKTSDNNKVYYNSKYPSINAAVEAYNVEHNTSFVVPNNTSSPTFSTDSSDSTVTMNITTPELSTHARKCSQINPPILLAWSIDLMKHLEDVHGGSIESTTLGTSMTTDQPDIARITYAKFILTVNEVTDRIHFGSITDDFEIITERDNYYSAPGNEICGCMGKVYIDDMKWGLPIYLGFDGSENTIEYKYLHDLSDVNSASSASSTISGCNDIQETYGARLPTYNHHAKTDPRFQPLKRPLGGFHKSSLFTLVPRFQTDIKGEPYFFMDLDQLNCIDEVAPYKNNQFAQMNNVNTGNPNSAFAKIPMSTIDEVAYTGSRAATKTYNPPLSRLRQLSIRLRFHNGRPVDVGIHQFSFVLEIQCAKR
jgi:hypothetical protein